MLVEKDSKLSRRTLLQRGMALGVATALPMKMWAAAAGGAVIKKAIPSTGEMIPAMGIGTNDLGRISYDDAVKILVAMHEMGGSLIDTAAEYGQSEVFIGKALTDQRLTQDMFIATKFNVLPTTIGMPTGAPPGADPPEKIAPTQSFERSVERLTKVDLMFAHHLSGVEELMPILLNLKRRRQIRYIGITSVEAEESPQVIEFMHKYPLDFVQVAYSLGNRENEKNVFRLARERKVAVMAAAPLGGHPVGTIGQHSASPLMAQVRGRELPSWAADFDATSWSQLFLKYALSHPDVTCAIAGASTLAHVQDNQAAGLGRLPDADMRRRIEDYWASLS